MEFSVVQRFACSPETYWNRSRGPEFEAAVAKEAEALVEALPPRQEGARLIERSRVTLLQPLTAVAQKAMGVERFTYIQEVETIDANFTTRWSIVPDVMKDRITIKGDTHVRGAQGGCERVIRGSIEVRIALVGSTIERGIAERVQRGYTRAEPVIRRFVEGT
ncbi:hypothetical protein LBMAG42_39870 [Deltaproteobacteria bacterium]|nr:hypothetical protein LBMAG42_39870 [Deltaproteobacteria bacterium]